MQDLKTGYYLYTYHFIDVFAFIRTPKEVDDALAYLYPGEEEEEENTLYRSRVSEIGDLFLRMGWEGDGDIGLIWIPPFLRITEEYDCEGQTIWHVKQRNNGTSYIASNFPLDDTYLEE